MLWYLVLRAVIASWLVLIAHWSHTQDQIRRDVYYCCWPRLQDWFEISNLVAEAGVFSLFDLHEVFFTRSVELSPREIALHSLQQEQAQLPSIYRIWRKAAPRGTIVSRFAFFFITRGGFLWSGGIYRTPVMMDMIYSCLAFLSLGGDGGTLGNI